MVRISRTGVVAGLLAAVVLGQVGGVRHVSRAQDAESDRRRAAADAAWIAQVRPLAAAVLLARAPISDAANLFQVGEAADAVRYDVYVRGSAAADLMVVSEQLLAVQPPAPRADVQSRLVAVLERMVDAVRRLADERDPDVEDELDDFAAATLEWDQLVAADVASDLPSATTLGSPGPLTRAGYLFRTSTACAEADDADEVLLEDPEAGREEVAVEIGLSADRLDELLTTLLEVPPAAADADQVQRELEPALRGLRETVPALRQLSDAVRAQDRASAAEAVVMLDRLAPLAETASRVFQAQGSSVCSAFFDSGVAVGEEPADDAIDT